MTAPATALSDAAFKNLRAAAEIIATTAPTWWTDPSHAKLRTALETVAAAPLASEESQPFSGDTMDAIILAARQLRERNALIERMAGFVAHAGGVLKQIESTMPVPAEPVARFLTQQTFRAKGSVTAAKAIYERYVLWCVRCNSEAVNFRSFGVALTREGLRRRHSNGVIYLDVALRAEGGQS